jgi:hypothetical protein
MKRPVEGLLDHEKKLNGPLPLVIEVKVLWGPDCWEKGPLGGPYQNSVKISAGVEELPVSSTTATRNGESNLGTRTLTRRLEDRVRFAAAIRTTNATFVDSDQGSGSAEFRMRDLLAGQVIQLHLFNNRVFLRLDPKSIPARPNMPEWRDRPVNAPPWWYYSIYAAGGILILGVFIFRVYKAASSP